MVARTHQRHARLFSMPLRASSTRVRPRLALEMETQATGGACARSVERQIAHRVHGDIGEHGLAHLHEQAMPDGVRP